MGTLNPLLAAPSEAELIEMERDIDWLESQCYDDDVDEDESIDYTVTMGLLRAGRIVDNMRRLVDFARRQRSLESYDRNDEI